MTRFPASVPRKMFWSDKVAALSRCPECGARLESEHHIYVMAVREHGDIQSFLMGTDAGYFCERCPVVVLDRDAFGELAAAGLRSQGRFKFSVLGLVDMDAVPEEKSSIPLGDDDNPIPLVGFTNLAEDRPKADTRVKRRAKQKRRDRRRRRR